jgi:hypothetical protein
LPPPDGTSSPSPTSQWEREALDWLRSHLPDRDSWHVWTNFEFIDDEGKVSEVDALVLSPPACSWSRSRAGPAC